MGEAPVGGMGNACPILGRVGGPGCSATTTMHQFGTIRKIHRSQELDTGPVSGHLLGWEIKIGGKGDKREDEGMHEGVIFVTQLMGLSCLSTLLYSWDETKRGESYSFEKDQGPV